MKLTKLHLLSEIQTSKIAGIICVSACGMTDEKGHIDFTNDPATMESLPPQKVCKKCLYAIRSRQWD